MAKEDAKKEGPAEFFSTAYAELKKVHFPTRQEAVQDTIRILMLLVFVAIFLGLTDLIVGKVVQGLLY